MARRASSRTHTGLILGIILGIVALVFAGKYWMSSKPSSLTDAPPLQVKEFLENGNSLRENEYRVEGKVDERFVGDQAQVISLRVSTPAGDEFIGLVIPTKFTTMNIEREQKYSFKVRIHQGGIPVATEVNRL